MAGALRKTMLYLGLAEDDRGHAEEDLEEYDDVVATEYEAEVTPLQRRRAIRRDFMAR